tara:strand:- start:450 stop:1757 length:1308 start_codon:yes stop_codon:yes gene_type:complete
MSLGIFPHQFDTKGNLENSSAPSSGNDLVNKSYADASIAVTVSSGKFVLDGESQATASLQKSVRFVFDVSDSSNSGHVLRFSATSDGTHGGGSAYSTGVTSSGTPGQSGAYVAIEVSQVTPDLLYYYCTAHSGMGGSVQSASVGEDIRQSSGKVGIGVSPSHKLDVNGDIRVRGNNVRDNSGNSAITFDGSANTQIDGDLTVASGKTVTLNTVTYTFPSSDGSSGQFLSTNSSGGLSWSTASGGGGGGGFSLSSIDANITIGEIQTAFNAASAKGWSVSPSGLSIPSGKTLLGVSCELQNTLGKDSYGSFSPIYSACGIGIEDPSGSTVMPTFIGGAWNAGTNYSQGSPYLSAQVGPALGWYYQDSSYNSNYILNDGTTTTDYITSFGSACIKVSSSTQVKVYFYEDTSSSTTFKINSTASASTSVVAKLTIFYA